MQLYNYFNICLIAQLATTSAGSTTAPSISSAPSVSNMPSSALRPVDLGTAGNYVILAKSGISTVPDSTITGDIAVSPITSTAMTGFSETNADGTAATSDQVSGNLYGADYLEPIPTDLTAAVSDMETAYTDAAGRPNPDAARINLNGGILSGDTLYPGVYTFGTTVEIKEDIFFCGNHKDVFIIQVTNQLNIASNKKVILDCGAKAENIFWQVAEAVTIGTGAHMEGSILGFTSVSLNTGSSLNGGIYSQTAVSLQVATVEKS
jgi:hypothetical protein